MSFDNDQETDPLSATFTSRRIPHGRSGGGKGKGKGKGSNSASNAFNPLRALGYYEVQLGSKGKSKAGKGKSKGKGGDKHGREPEQNGSESATSWLEIHELTEGDDGFVGTFAFIDASNGGIEGMCLLAGSRKGLQAIVDEIEAGSDEDEDEGEGEGEDEEHETQATGPGNQEPKRRNNTEDDDNDSLEEEESDSETTSSTESSPEQSALEAADAKLNNRYQAFEKNSFRNPKFWIRWKGHVRSNPATSIGTSSQSTEESKTGPETDQGYLVFASNACDRFEGTISCESLAWDNFKISGWKIRSKATGCTVGWGDF